MLSYMITIVKRSGYLSKSPLADEESDRVFSSHISTSIFWYEMHTPQINR